MLKLKLPAAIGESMRALLTRTLAVLFLWVFGKVLLGLGIAAPFWIFLLVVTYTYFFPVFRQGVMLVPFLIFLVLSIYLPLSVWGFFGLGIVFFLLMGIKDLLFVNREGAYEILVFLFLFILSIVGYSVVQDWSGWEAVILPLSAALAYFSLAYLLPWQDPPRENRVMVPVLLFSLLFAEVSWVLTYLSMDWLYKSALLFMFGVLLVELQSAFRKKDLTYKYILSAFLPFAILAGALLILNNWGI